MPGIVSIKITMFILGLTVSISAHVKIITRTIFFTQSSFMDIMMRKEYLKRLSRIYQEIMKKNQCLTIRELEINGKDLIEDGMMPGKAIGEILSKLLGEVLEEPDKNKKEILLKESRKLRGMEA